VHPELIARVAALRRQELAGEAEAEAARRHRAGRPPSGRLPRARAALGNRMVAVGWRLVDAGTRARLADACPPPAGWDDRLA
jgi:hypothetical protein